MEMVIEPAAKRLKLSISGITVLEDAQLDRKRDGIESSCTDPIRKQNNTARHDKASKVEMMQKKLTSLLHARNCKGNCTNALCPQMKNILAHLDKCVAGKDCPDSQCRSVRQMLYHFKTCRKTDCDLCLSVRLASPEATSETILQYGGVVINTTHYYDSVSFGDLSEIFSQINAVSSTDTALPTIVPHATSNHTTTTGGSNRVETSSNPTVKQNENAASESEIRRLLLPTWKVMYHMMPHAMLFRQPVDTSLVPDYLSIIKTPMDLSTIHKKLESGLYQDPWHYIEDVQLMFDNAWLYNKRTSPVYKSCTKLAEKFESVIDAPMRKLGYCCGQRPIFRPLTMYCFSHQGCTIPIYGAYYNYEDLYAFCEKCFTSKSGNTIEVQPDGLSQSVILLKKEQFKKVLNNRHDPEPYVQCKCCERRQHQICVLHTDQIWPTGYVCDSCLRQQKLLKKQNLCSANKLVNTKLGAYLEDCVNSFLHRQGVIESGSNDGVVTIRVLSSSEKVTEVKPAMRARFPDGPSGFPYTSKSIFAFQNIEGVDVCFFGMHVQEYGSDCPVPNQRRVYLAYLDSVNFFRPKVYRTAAYQEIIIGYMKYVKSLGYLSVHIWACPPGDADDYIFHRHPVQQKIPKPKRLQDWYRKILERACSEAVVCGYKDIVSDACSISSITEIPYFDGDYWPNVLEETILAEHNTVDEQEAETNQGDKYVSHETATTGKAKKNGKVKKSWKSRKGTTTEKGVPNTLVGKVLSTMEKHREVFFVVHLQPADCMHTVPSITDPDICLQGDLMDGRVPFLQFCSDQRLEFSSVRRAKFSSMVLLYELHSEQETGVSRSIFTCRMCIRKATLCYTCPDCEDLNLCSTCYDKAGHQHQMTKRGGEGDDSIMKCIETLAHASQCTQDDFCPEKESCRRMANVLSHARQCRLRNSCPVCRQLVALCVTHSRKCTVPVGQNCPVPFCAELRVDLDRRRQEQRRHQQKMVDCRLAVMTASHSVGSEASERTEESYRTGTDLARCSSYTGKRSESLSSASESCAYVAQSSPANYALNAHMPQGALDECHSRMDSTTPKSSKLLMEEDAQVLTAASGSSNCVLGSSTTSSSLYSPPKLELCLSLSEEFSLLPSSDPTVLDSATDVSIGTTSESPVCEFSTGDVIGKPDRLTMSTVDTQPLKRISELPQQRRGHRQLADIANQLPAKVPACYRPGEVSSLRANHKSQSFQSSYSEFLIGSSSTTHIYIQSSNGSKTIVQFNSGDAGPIDSNDLLAHLADRL